MSSMGRMSIVVKAILDMACRWRPSTLEQGQQNGYKGRPFFAAGFFRHAARSFHEMQKPRYQAPPCLALDCEPAGIDDGAGKLNGFVAGRLSKRRQERPRLVPRPGGAAVRGFLGARGGDP